ncbi:MAG TPA: ArsR family transcriptional regulator [Candidatus Nitrosopolaris sp.]|nr:ArsR family transcriptional regulator [Candidatus Nitrosopolaris sp.]
MDKIFETDRISHSTGVWANTGENIPSRDTKFQDLEEVSSSSEELSQDLHLDIQSQMPSELQLIQDFRSNDNKILSLLNQQQGSYFSFKGLMRKLNLHQQSLSRSLSRLKELGLIQRSVNGYKLNKSEHHIPVMPLPDNKTRNDYKQLLETYIPTGIKTEEIVQALNGRWFSRIRWIGLMESEIGHTLQWISEARSFQINVRIIFNHLIIETNALSDEDKIEAMVGSCKIFEQITKLFQTRLQGSNVKGFNSVRYVA